MNNAIKTAADLKILCIAQAQHAVMARLGVAPSVGERRGLYARLRALDAEAREVEAGR